MDESSLLHTLASPGLIVCYIFALVALVTSVGMPIFNAIKNPAGLIKGLIGVVGLAILFGISYALSGSEVTPRFASLGVDASSSKLIGAGMIMFYIILISSAILAIYSLLKDIITG
ncbi:MAG: hypothetical protein ACKVOQ_17855 [Cyclobacteriaceae bacterium]